MRECSPPTTIQNTAVQSIELQGNRCSTGKSLQNSRDNGIAKFAGATPLMTVQLTEIQEWPQLKRCPPAKVMSPWSRGTGIAKFSGAAPFLTVQLTAIQGAVPPEVVFSAKVVPPQRHQCSWCQPLCQGIYFIK